MIHLICRTDDDDLIKKIKEQPIAKQYCEKFYELLRNGDFNN